MTTLTDSTAYQDTLTAYSSDLFRYQIPISASDGGFTTAVKISVISDSSYSDIELYMSLCNINYFH